MSQSQKHKIIIVGAGIAGLTSALCLRQAGHDVTILEQASALEDIGAGIQLSPNALYVLNVLGISDTLASKADIPSELSIRDFKSGIRLLNQKMGSTFYHRYGASYWHCHRADLIEALFTSSQKAGVQILFNEKTTSYEETTETCNVKTLSGKSFSADFLVGADGISSKIRTTLLSNSMVDFTGQIAWRGLVPTERLETQPSEGVSVWVGPGKHFVSYRLRHASLMNFVAVEERDEWTEENWKLSGDVEKLRGAFEGWDDPVQDILQGCDETYLWGLFDRHPPKTWHSARVILIGDACHPILPFMAQGAAMAIEDAYVLAATLKNNTSIAATFKLFQQQRQKRIKRIYDISRRNAALYHASGVKAVARNILFAMSHIFPRTISYQLDSIYSYNVVA